MVEEIESNNENDQEYTRAPLIRTGYCVSDALFCFKCVHISLAVTYNVFFPLFD